MWESILHCDDSVLWSHSHHHWLKFFHIEIYALHPCIPVKYKMIDENEMFSSIFQDLNETRNGICIKLCMKSAVSSYIFKPFKMDDFLFNWIQSPWKCILPPIKPIKRSKSLQNSDDDTNILRLIQNGADVNLADGDNKLAIHWASLRGEMSHLFWNFGSILG